MVRFRYIVTSAWPYASGIPHLGNFVGSVLSGDVLARFYRLGGHEVLYVSGSDEHGTPIEVAALKAGVGPKELVDKNHKKIAKIFEDFGIQYDNYSRTSGKNHVEFVQEYYKRVYDNGYIFDKEVEQLYCKKCDRYLPDRFVEGGCPHCGFGSARGDQCDSCGKVLNPTELKKPYCVVCKGTPEVKKTKQWFFDLPKFSKKLETWIGDLPWPENAKNFSLGWIREGLEPRTLTRDIKWGVPAPFDKEKTIYVWNEAVLGYISAVKEIRKDWEEWWKDPETKTIFCIGKDNVPFHTIVFPALLLANDEKFALPWGMASTEYLNFAGQQFSKSRGVGVWLDDALELYPPDYWRYVLLATRPEVRDSNFDWGGFQKRINTELNDVLGNFVYRTLSFCQRFFDGKVPKPERLDKRDKEVLEKVEETKKNVATLLDSFKIQQALREAMQIAHIGNQYLNEREPWKTVKGDRERTGTTINVCLGITKVLAVVIEPFLPFTSEEVWKELGLKEKRSWGVTPEIGGKLGKIQPLFKKIEDDEVQKLKERTGLGVEGGDYVKYEDFAKLDLRVAEVVAAEKVKGKDKLLKLDIRIGDEERTIVAGVAEHYKPGELVGRKIVVLANLEPKKIGDLESKGMLLAAEQEGTVSLIVLDKDIPSGAKVC